MYTEEQIIRVQEILRSNEGALDFHGNAKDFENFRYHFGNRTLQIAGGTTTLDECYDRLSRLYPKDWEFSLYGNNRSEISIVGLNHRFDDNVPLVFTTPFTPSELAIIFESLEPLAKTFDMSNVDVLELRPGVVLNADDPSIYMDIDYTDKEIAVLSELFVNGKLTLEYRGPGVVAHGMIPNPDLRELAGKDLKTKMCQNWKFTIAHNGSNFTLSVRDHIGKGRTYVVYNLKEVLYNLEPLDRYAYLDGRPTMLELRKDVWTL